MGGSVEAEPFKYFGNLLVRAFLAVRLHSQRLMSLVALMVDAGLPCIRKETLDNLRYYILFEENVVRQFRLLPRISKAG